MRLNMNTSRKESADKIFKQEKYGMMFCTACVGSGRRKVSETVTVCQVCGGFGLIIKKQEKHNLYKFPVRITG